MKKNNNLVCFITFKIRNVSLNSAEKERTRRREKSVQLTGFWHKVSRQAVTAYYAFF